MTSKPKMQSVPEPSAALQQCQQQIEELQLQLVAAEEREKRALADYHNLKRRVQEERLQTVQRATSQFVEVLVQPLEHLSLAAKQLNNAGLTMVITQLWQTMQQFGLEEFDPLGQPFDVKTMEVVSKRGDGDTVVEVASRGYMLHGTVVKFAQVIVGDAAV